MPERLLICPRQLKPVEYTLIYKTGSTTVSRPGQKTTYVYHIPICQYQKIKYLTFESRKNLEPPLLYIPDLEVLERKRLFCLQQELLLLPATIQELQELLSYSVCARLQKAEPPGQLFQRW